MKLLLVLLILVGFILLMIKGNKPSGDINEDLQITLYYYEKTYGMSWLEAHSILSAEISDEVKKDNIKMKVKALRELRNID